MLSLASSWTHLILCLISALWTKTQWLRALPGFLSKVSAFGPGTHPSPRDLVQCLNFHLGGGGEGGSCTASPLPLYCQDACCSSRLHFCRALPTETSNYCPVCGHSLRPSPPFPSRTSQASSSIPAGPCGKRAVHGTYRRGSCSENSHSGKGAPESSNCSSSNSCDEENPWNLLNYQTQSPSKEILSRGLNIFNTQEVLIMKQIWKAQENDPVTAVVTIY